MELFSLQYNIKTYATQITNKHNTDTKHYLNSFAHGSCLKQKQPVQNMFLNFRSSWLRAIVIAFSCVLKDVYRYIIFYSTLLDVKIVTRSMAVVSKNSINIISGKNNRIRLARKILFTSGDGKLQCCWF